MHPRCKLRLVSRREEEEEEDAAPTTPPQSTEDGCRLHCRCQRASGQRSTSSRSTHSPPSSNTTGTQKSAQVGLLPAAGGSSPLRAGDEATWPTRQARSSRGRGG